ncbi:DUF4031 domain-containing protein [Raineyella fluvialis]|uniref:DUF4031 domain-containing protein n=1 Tax=Raineyella fluvialis TaxID=2662261 RepID=A0A5Q2FE14_9ACTN|nr:DUF4031 domain-containing protein [Raineyella fluvialis]QGF23684.1 DUF4031 domain-containing protein [Raineyella fluvialis]
MLLVDPPLWPAHGTRFSHLVSDTSLAELHDFADRIGLTARAFDRDHYDLPAGRYADAVAAGALEVTPTEVVRALRRAGLRRTKPQVLAAARRREERLLAQWEGLLPRAPDLGVDLLGRWSEPHRRYHTPQHLAEMLRAMDEVVADLRHHGDPGRPVRLAAWFHDAVYEGRPGEDEEASAVLAERSLDGLVPAREVAEVARLVRLTAAHVAEDDDPVGDVLLDADLAILGADDARYLEYSRQIRAEYHHVTAEDYRRGRLAVLAHLAGLDPLYRTHPARAWWTDPARRNVAEEQRRLEGATGRE